MRLPLWEQRSPPHNPVNTHTTTIRTEKKRAKSSSLIRHMKNPSTGQCTTTITKYMLNIKKRSCTLAYSSKHRAASVCLLVSRSFSKTLNEHYTLQTLITSVCLYEGAMHNFKIILQHKTSLHKTVKVYTKYKLRRWCNFMLQLVMAIERQTCAAFVTIWPLNYPNICTRFLKNDSHTRTHNLFTSPPRSLASCVSCSGARGMCVATARACLQLIQLTKAWRARTVSPHRHSNSPACSAWCCSTRCSA